MDYQELMNKYIDGELELSDEEQFFSEVASNEELRNNMRRILAVRRSVRDNLSSFMPPAQVTLGLFNKLGIAPPQSNIINPDKSTPPIRENFWNKYKQGIVSGVTSSIMTFIIIWLFLLNNSEFNNKLSDSNSKFNSGLNSENNSGLNSNISSINSKSNNSDSKEINKKNNIPKAKSYSDNFNSKNINSKNINSKNSNLLNNSILENKSENNPIENKKENISDNFISNSKDITYNSNNLINSSNISNNLNNKDFNKIPVVISNSDLKNSNILKNLGFSLEFTGTANWSMPKENIAPSEYSKFNNMSLALIYDLGSGLYIGGELRRENFYQKFQGQNTLGLMNNFEQQPNFTTYCLSARYVYELNNRINPFIQLDLGGNSIGPVSRGLIGFSYAPYSDLYFNLGAEYSYMLYKYQNNIFNSSKLSLCYGVGYKF